MAPSVDVKWNGKAVLAAERVAALRGVRMWAEYVLTESRAVVPLDEATLERSGRVVADARRIEAIVSYDTPYAVRQHEDLTYRHAPGRTAKYLERPWRRSRRIGPAIVAKQIRKALQ